MEYLYWTAVQPRNSVARTFSSFHSRVPIGHFLVNHSISYYSRLAPVRLLAPPRGEGMVLLRMSMVLVEYSTVMSPLKNVDRELY